MHSFRAACSITISLLRASLEDVARRVGWRSLDTAAYYTLAKQVMDTAKFARMLSTGT
jgi:hypothetical protein